MNYKEFIEIIFNLNPYIRNKELIVKKELDLDKSKVLVDSKYGECVVTKNYLIKGKFVKINQAIDKNKFFKVKAEEVHGLTYDYANIDYKKSYLKVIIKCSKHGEFQQLPNDHLNKGYGCKKCSTEYIAENNKFSTQHFISTANEIHHCFYDYSKVVYEGIENPVIIGCPKHGYFLQKPNYHLNNKSGCKSCAYENNGSKKRLKEKDFINKSKEKYPGECDYSKVKLVDKKTKIEIICNKHGSYFQTPAAHYQSKGCPKCKSVELSKSKFFSLEKFIALSSSIHNGKYEYDEVKYNGTRKKVKIKCPIHGYFNQEAGSHLRGVGCPKCNDSGGFTKTRWKEKGSSSNYFTGFKVYIIKCYKEKEVFYKIGRTFRDLKIRFGNNTHMPYDYKIIKIIEGESDYIYDLETLLKNKHRYLSYTPAITFHGSKECFKDLDFEEVNKY